MRTTNLIQSYVNNNPNTQQYKSDKASKDFNVQRELSNRTFIKPLPSNGKLVNLSIMDYPSEVKKDFIYNTKAIYHAIKGEANDHELGRINDVAMKFGGLALATYLFTKKNTPKTKLFEFIGLGTFFAAMDIWPKLFIQLPAKLIHGVNVRQQYEDNYGRKKMFYQDHQFIPWDLYSEEEIEKIGDRLRVPKDIPNRRDFIQEKMRKIALQNNTLWMLTAGFATPLMSALMCNVLEKPIGKLTGNAVDNKAGKYISHFADEVKKIDMQKNAKELEAILSANAGKPITEELITKLVANLSDGLDSTVAVEIENDLNNILKPNQSFKVSEGSVANIQKVITDVIKEEAEDLPDDLIKKILPDADGLTEGLRTRGLLNGNFNEFTGHSTLIQDIVAKNVEEVAKTVDAETAETLRYASRAFVHSRNPQLTQAPLFKTLRLEPASVLTDGNIKFLKEVSKILNLHKPEETVLNKAIFLKVAQDSETALADIWNETASEIFKSLKFSNADIKKARLDNELAAEVLGDKLEKLVSDKAAYSQFIEKMESLLTSLHSKTSSLNMSQDGDANALKSLISSTYDRTSAALLDKGMRETASTLGGIIDGGNNFLKDTASTRLTMSNFVDQRVMGVKSSFYRFLNLTDLYYRIAHLPENDSVLNDRMLREVKEELVDLAKKVTMGGHTADYVVKFCQKRNPHPENPNDFSQVETSNGRVINRYFGKGEHETIELTNDKKFYEDVMKFLFDQDIHPDTYEKIKNAGFLEDFKKYRKEVYEVFGGLDYFPKPGFKVKLEGDAPSATSIKQFLLTGCVPQDMAFKEFNNMFNSGKWFSMFGKFGLGLAAVTVLAQFFIGHTKNPTDKEVQA